MRLVLVLSKDLSALHWKTRVQTPSGVICTLLRGIFSHAPQPTPRRPTCQAECLSKSQDIIVHSEAIFHVNYYVLCQTEKVGINVALLEKNV